MSVIEDFKAFALRGNVIDLAVGVVIGAAFGKIVDSLVKDIIMPPIGFVLGKVDFSNFFIVLKEGAVDGPYATVDVAAKSGALTLNLGLFINTLIAFLIVSWAIFMVIKGVNAVRKTESEKVVEKIPSDEIKLLTEIRDLLKK